MASARLSRSLGSYPSCIRRRRRSSGRRQRRTTTTTTKTKTTTTTTLASPTPFLRLSPASLLLMVSMVMIVSRYSRRGVTAVAAFSPPRVHHTWNHYRPFDVASMVHPKPARPGMFRYVASLAEKTNDMDEVDNEPDWDSLLVDTNIHQGDTSVEQGKEEASSTPRRPMPPDLEASLSLSGNVEDIYEGGGFDYDPSIITGDDDDEIYGYDESGVFDGIDPGDFIPDQSSFVADRMTTAEAASTGADQPTKPRTKPKATSSTQRPVPPPTPSDTRPRPSSTNSEQKKKQRQSQPKQQSRYPGEQTVEEIEEEVEELVESIYHLNGGKKFNVNSNPQVSEVLFGEPGRSTNKDVLEIMASDGNKIASLIQDYRKLNRKLKRLKKKDENKTSGTYVSNISTVNATEVKADGDPLILVDASAYIFRAYYSMPPMHRSDGTPIGAVLGFCNMVNRLVLDRLLDGECPRLVFVFDAKGKTFRNDMYDKYKANRQQCPMDLVPQFSLIREAVSAYGAPQIEASYYEADDVIATLATMARQEGVDTHILSGDKDLMQLVTSPDEDPCVHMIDPMSMNRVTYEEVVSKWGVPPELIGDMLALAGDSADNIPGVKGIGAKIAKSLLEEFGSLDALLERADEVKQKSRREKLVEQKEQAILSRKLVDLERAVPQDAFSGSMIEDMNGSVAGLRTGKMDPPKLLTFFKQMGFRDLTRRFESKLAQLERNGSIGGGKGGGSIGGGAAGGTAAAKEEKGTETSQRKASTSTAAKKRKTTWRNKTSIPKPEDFEDVPF